MRTTVCRKCQKEFKNNRSTAVFCSARCRVAAFREQEKTPEPRRQMENYGVVWSIGQPYDKGDTVKLVELIHCLLKKGDSTADNPIRMVNQYWTKSGQLLWENDPYSSWAKLKNSYSLSHAK